jgi:hypothetical protein
MIKSIKDGSDNNNKLKNKNKKNNDDDWIFLNN